MPKSIPLPLASRDFDPTEVAVPWKLLTAAGYRVVLATEDGRPHDGAGRGDGDARAAGGLRAGTVLFVGARFRGSARSRLRRARSINCTKRSTVNGGSMDQSAQASCYAGSVQLGAQIARKGAVAARAGLNK